MGKDLETFVAHDLWLLIGIVTFAFAALTAIAGLGGIMLVGTILGWFLLTPIFMFWGDEIAALAFDDESEPPVTESTEPNSLEELKRRYAAGEIDEATFERRLERLVALDDLPADVLDRPSTGSETRTGLEREPDRELEREPGRDLDRERE